MKKPEKLCGQGNAEYKRDMKKLAVRAMRRAAKRDPENAIKKRPTWGWTT